MWFRLYAIEDASIGEEVYTCYGNLSNSQMLLDYGFLFDFNTDFDEVPISVSIYDMMHHASDHPLNNKAALLDQISENFSVEEWQRGVMKGGNIPKSLRIICRLIKLPNTDKLDEEQIEKLRKGKAFSVQNEQQALEYLDELFSIFLTLHKGIGSLPLFFLFLFVAHLSILCRKNPRKVEEL